MKSSSDSEIDEDDIAQCIKEYYQDSSRSECICEKIIKYLVGQNASAQAIYYFVPPVTQPPTFIAPLCRPPGPMPPPPQAAMALPPPPIPYYPQNSGASHLPQSAQPLQQPPFTRSNNLCGAVSMGAPRFSPPYSPPYPPPYSPPMSCSQYQFQQPPPMTGLTVPPQSIPQAAPSMVSQCANYGSQSACFQPEVNAAAVAAAATPCLDACNQESVPPPPHRSSLAAIQKTDSGHPTNDLPLAFTLSFAGTADAPACAGNESNGLPNYANGIFLCTQICP
ncbi:unnamed protein product [Taenia asiatica]|uniref:Uncharacterized protein n=1 Tax=Taenia asiatica TaxID=60517 RepID=A0A3P6PJK8_TAEAS|nr:unnamed protein product [Taenia asiatica]